VGRQIFFLFFPPWLKTIGLKINSTGHEPEVSQLNE